MLVQEKNSLQAPLNKSILSGIKTVITCLEKQINNIEKLTDEIIDKNKDLTRKREILMTVPWEQGGKTTVSWLYFSNDLPKVAKSH
jgi:hypothetical protein